MIKLVIFDFDGVLADSFDAFYLLIRDGMKKIGLPLTTDQYRDLFLGNVHQGFKDLINNKQKFLIFSKFRKKNYDIYYYNERSKVKLFPETSSFLKRISKKYVVTIVSSGHQKNVEDLLVLNKVRSLFDLVIANTATTKADAIKGILTKFKVKPKETIMITDTVGDIKVAKKVGLKTIAVTWGFHSAKLLRSTKPGFVANSFKILYKKLKAF